MAFDFGSNAAQEITCLEVGSDSGPYLGVPVGSPAVKSV